MENVKKIIKKIVIAEDKSLKLTVFLGTVPF